MDAKGLGVMHQSCNAARLRRCVAYHFSRRSGPFPGVLSVRS